MTPREAPFIAKGSNSYRGLGSALHAGSGPGPAPM